MLNVVQLYRVCQSIGFNLLEWYGNSSVQAAQSLAYQTSQIYPKSWAVVPFSTEYNGRLKMEFIASLI